MGTSIMGSDTHSDKQDKVLKLQARKKELELLLAAKNEELYKLCVQEVQLTGVMPPEAPLSPDVPQRERLGSIRSVERSTDGNDVHDGTDNTSRRYRAGTSDKLHESDQILRKHYTHRLSTPSISGMSSKSTHSRQVRRPETSCSNFFPSPPQERTSDTFSIHTSHTFPVLSNHQDSLSIDNMHMDGKSPVYRNHAITTEYMNKIYYNNTADAQNASRLRETHFSSSHPDITTHYTQGNMQLPPQSNNGLRNTPLLYQYASQLKSQNQHLGSLSHNHKAHLPPKRRQDGVRRNTLQRTQTYHLTSNSDYNQHLDSISDNFRQQIPFYQHRSQPDIQEQPSDKIHASVDRVVPNTLPLRERNIMRNPMNMQQLQVSTEEYARHYPETLSPVSQLSGYSQSNFDSVSVNQFSPLSQAESKFKEKQWYETSLDSPTKCEAPLFKKTSSLKRTSSVGNSQTYEIMVNSGRSTSVHSPNQMPSSPLSPGAMSLESPKNLTVIEQGKCIPYREESKPFEMSDFYKYSTKFRQTNAPKPPAPNPVPSMGFNKLPMELPQYAQEQWHGQNK